MTATSTFTIAPVRKTIVVNATQATCFDVFTRGIDRWWPKSHNLGATPLTESIIEPRQGGRWYSVHEDGSETVTGIMKVWEPPSRVVFSWDINADWKPDTTVGSEVEVRFIAEGPSRTRVELEHRAFEAMGQTGGEKMRAAVDGGWTGIMDLFKAAAEG